MSTALLTSTRLSYVAPVRQIGHDVWQGYHPGIYPRHSRPLSLATTVDGFVHRRKRNGEFCDLDSGNTGSSQLKTLAVNLNREGLDAR